MPANHIMSTSHVVSRTDKGARDSPGQAALMRHLVLGPVGRGFEAGARYVAERKTPGKCFEFIYGEEEIEVMSDSSGLFGAD